MRQWYRFCRFLCRAYVGVIHLGRVYDRCHVPVSGPVLLVGNHQSVLDPVLAAYALPREVHYMARDTLFANPLFGRLISSVNAFPVKRDEVDIAAIKETLRRLKGGRAVLLFPEGTRSTDGRIAEFKPGLAMLARKAGAPVVPVVIDGAYEAWPRTSPLPRPLMPIHAVYGPAYSPADVQRMPPEAFVRHIHRQMIRMQSDLRERTGKRAYDYPEVAP